MEQQYSPGYYYPYALQNDLETTSMPISSDLSDAYPSHDATYQESSTPVSLSELNPMSYSDWLSGSYAHVRYEDQWQQSIGEYYDQADSSNIVAAESSTPTNFENGYSEIDLNSQYDCNTQFNYEGSSPLLAPYSPTLSTSSSSISRDSGWSTDIDGYTLAGQDTLDINNSTSNIHFKSEDDGDNHQLTNPHVLYQFVEEELSRLEFPMYLPCDCGDEHGEWYLLSDGSLYSPSNFNYDEQSLWPPMSSVVTSQEGYAPEYAAIVPDNAEGTSSTNEYC